MCDYCDKGKSLIELDNEAEIQTRIIKHKETKLFPHALRHSRLQSLMEGTDERVNNKKFSLDELKILANHESSVTTESYIRKDNSETINNLFGL